MIKRILKILLGILSFPVCIAVSVSLYNQLNSIAAISYYSRKYFFIVIIAYLIAHAVVLKPDYLYIFGHEVMHVLATWLSGGKVSSFRVSPKGGSVSTSKSNIFISLAPYFFPFYTIIVAFVYDGAQSLFIDAVAVSVVNVQYPVAGPLVRWQLSFE